MDVSRETLKLVYGDEKVENEFEKIIEELIHHPENYRQKVLEVYAKQKNEDKEICTKCGGRCCLKAPCHFAPSDFPDLTYNALKKTMKAKKYISVVRFSSELCQSALRQIKVDDPYFYVMRIRTSGTGQAAKLEEVEADDLCVKLTSTGCALSYEERPLGAKLLIPKKDRKCSALYGMDECIDDWKNHQKVLRRLYRHFRPRQIWKELFENLVHL